MFDNIINNAKGALDMVIMFFVAALVGKILMTLVTGGSFSDFMPIVYFAVSAAVAGFATSLMLGAAK